MTVIEAPLDDVLHIPEMTGKTVEKVTFDRDSGGYCRLIVQFTDGFSITALEQGYAGWFNIKIVDNPKAKARPAADTTPGSQSLVIAGWARS